MPQRLRLRLGLRGWQPVCRVAMVLLPWEEPLPLLRPVRRAPERLAPCQGRRAQMLTVVRLPCQGPRAQMLTAAHLQQVAVPQEQQQQQRGPGPGPLALALALALAPLARDLVRFPRPPPLRLVRERRHPPKCRRDRSERSKRRSRGVSGVSGVSGVCESEQQGGSGVSRDRRKRESENNGRLWHWLDNSRPHLRALRPSLEG